MHLNKILKHTIAWKLINTVLVFLINLMIVRILGAAQSGTFFYDITLLSFLVLIGSWSLESGITYYTSKNNSIIFLIVIIILPLLLIQGLISLVILRYIHLSVSSYLSILFILSNLIITYFSALFYAQKWFIATSIIICSINFVTTFVLFNWLFFKTFTAGNNSTIILIYIGSVAIQAFLLVVVILFFTKKSKISFTLILPVVKNIFTYSTIAFISNVVSFLVSRIDYFFVQKYCSDIKLSNYIQVSKFGQLLILIPSIIGGIIVPLSAGNSKIMSISKVQQLCRGITFIFIPLTVIIIFTANWFFVWMFGKGFNYMYIATLLYIPGFFSLSIITILAAHLAGNNFLRANMIACIVALIVVVTGDWWLVPIFGINAAAAVSSMAYLTYLFFLLIVYKRIFNCTVVDFFSLKKVEIEILFRQFKKIFTS